MSVFRQTPGRFGRKGALFPQFTDRGLFGRFTRLDLTAGEFPQAAEVTGRGAQRHQPAFMIPNQGDGDPE